MKRNLQPSIKHDSEYSYAKYVHREFVFYVYYEFIKKLRFIFIFCKISLLVL